MTGVDKDLATLREALAIGWPEGDHAEPHVFTEALDALARVRDSLERLQSLWLAERELRLAEQAAHRQTNEEAEALAEELERLQEPRDETGYPAWSGLPNDPLVRFTSASWHCPVCDRRGDVHDERCLVLELVTVARRRKDGNRRLVETNGRLRETAEAAEARFTESEARCARLREELARVAGLHERDFGHPGETPEGAATEPLGQESLDRGEALDGLSFVGGADLDGDGNGGGETGKRASGHMPNHTAYGMESKLEAAEARCARLTEENERLDGLRALYLQSADDWSERCARLQQALAGLESAVRILDVMLREPAAEGLMSAEDYRSYVQGAWLGVDEAAEKAREALAGQTSGSGSSAADLSVGERQGRQPDPGEIAGLLVELARWSRVAELNGDLHARIASALAGPDTLTAGEPGVAPDGTGRVAPADGCAERQSTADPSPAASAEPDTPADICPECGSGLITLHVAAYPCSRRNTPADSLQTVTCDCGETVRHEQWCRSVPRLIPEQEES